MLLIQNLQIFLCKHRYLWFFGFLNLLLALILDLHGAQTLAESALERAFPLCLPMLKHQLWMRWEALHRPIIQRERSGLAHDWTVLVPTYEPSAVAIRKLLIRQGVIYSAEWSWVLLLAKRHRLWLPILTPTWVQICAGRCGRHNRPILEDVLIRCVNWRLTLRVKVVLPLRVEVVTQRELLIRDVLVHFRWWVGPEIVKLVDSIF